MLALNDVFPNDVPLDIVVLPAMAVMPAPWAVDTATV
jgi:hypothetical protein